MGAIITTPLAVVSADKFPVTPVANGLVPDEALAITCNLQFSPTVQAILIDLSESARKFNVIPIQGAFIDTSGSAIDLRVDNSVTGQSVLAKAGLQGYYNLLCPMPAKLIAVLASAPAAQLNITMILYNTVIESEVWGLTSGPAGATGPQGPPGATGATGSQGPAGPAGVIASVQNQGTAVTPARSVLNFTGAGVTATDDSVNTRTNITIPGTPIATATVLGGVKTGTNVSIAADGTISVPPVTGFQTPWLSSINGAGNSLSNANTVSANNYTYAGTTANPSVEQWSMNGLLRWRWVTTIPEGGSNTGTNLQLQGYADDGSTIIDNPAIWITRSNGFVGIATSSPNTTLDVSGSGRFSGNVTPTSGQGLEISYGAGVGALYSYNRTGAAWQTLSLGGGPILLNGLSPIPGNVGIGTPTPIYQLDIRTPGAVAGIPQIHLANTNTDVGGYLTSGADNQLSLSAGVAYNGTNWMPKSTSANLITMQNGGFVFYGDTGLTVGTSYSPTARVIVQAGGNVGIGTTLPSTHLQIVGLGAVTTSFLDPTANIGNCVYVQDSGGAAGYGGYFMMGASQGSFCAIKGELTGAAGPQGDMVFFIRANSASATMNEAMRIMASGNVGIQLASPTHLLELGADSAAKPTTNTWTISSGAKVKRNVKRLTGGLSIINQLRPTEAQYNGRGGTPDGQRVVSLIAEEVREILPHTVTEDANGNLGFNVHEVIHHLILAVQQLSKKLEKVEAPA